MKIAIVGAGLIGERRARAASSHPATTLALAIDIDKERASGLGRELGCAWGLDWREAVECGDIDAVVVATPNNLLAPVSMAALKAGKHVLCEKPMAICVDDAERMVETASGSGVTLMVGYTLRHHPAIAKARELLASCAVGEPMFVRGCYGHGGRSGYEAEWRFDPEISGGGELIDQGVHLIDLSRWFLGEFDEVSGTVSASFWDIVPLEDNVFATLRTPAGRVASFHASCTQWKNRFTFEVFGKNGYLIVEGLGGSYGPERLVHGIRDAENPPPKEETFLFDEVDIAWRNEWGEFVQAIEAGREPLVGGHDGLQVLRIVEAIYRSAKSKKAEKL